jgi:hypothetical protein
LSASTRSRSSGGLAEQLGQQVVVQGVGLVLERVDVLGVPGEGGDVGELRHRRGGGRSCPAQDLDLRADAGRQHAEQIDHDPRRGLFHGVHDVVQRGGQPVDVLTVEGRDKGGVEHDEDVVGEAVPRQLRILDPPARPARAHGSAATIRARSAVAARMFSPARLNSG